MNKYAMKIRCVSGLDELKCYYTFWKCMKPHAFAIHLFGIIVISSCRTKVSSF